MPKYWNEELECASQEKMKALQNERLVNTVKLVYDNVPYYRAKMEAKGLTPDDIKSIDDLHKLPFLCKQDLRDTYPYGLFATDMKNVVRLHASSGTTGKQVVAGYTQEDLDMWADCVARALTAAGGDNTDTLHVAYGMGLFTGGFGAEQGGRKVGMTCVPISSGNTARQINVLKDFGCTILCCTPSYAMYIAETMKDMGLTKDDMKLKAGVFGAEPWTEEMRHDLEEKLGIKAMDIYGLTEVCGPGVAFECEEQSGMHINEDCFIPEIIDPETEEVLPLGEQGELVFTAINKQAFPLLRYRTRDICVLSREKCSCGRTLIKMMKPRGRTDDMLIIRGVNVFPSQIETVLLKIDDVAPYYQIIVDRVNNTDTFEILVEIAPDRLGDKISNLEKIERKIKAALDSTLGISAKIRLVEPKSIQRSEGKAVRVIDKRKLHD